MAERVKEVKQTTTYTCAECNGTFEKGWSDEEAVAQATTDFPGDPIEEMAVVCDDCYRKIMGLDSVKQ